MKYRTFEQGPFYCLAVSDGSVWMTFRFDDWESRNGFLASLGNISESLEEA